MLVAQLGVGVGSEQGLRALLLPSVSSRHQSGAAVDGLQVGVGRVLEQKEQDGEVTTHSSLHERGGAVAAWQVDGGAPLQHLLGDR